VRGDSRDARRWHHQRWTDEMFLRFLGSTRALPAAIRTFSNSALRRAFFHSVMKIFSSFDKNE
jgi:hypothetical protein